MQSVDVEVRDLAQPALARVIKRLDPGRVSTAGAQAVRNRIQRNFDLTPMGMIRDLNLRRAIFKKTAAYGHFGREEPDFTWERTDKAEVLKNGA